MADIVSNPINREKMKILFHEAYSKWKSNKNECRLHVKRDELYDEIIESFRKKECGQQLTSTKEYNWIKRYECVWENDEAVLHHKGKIVVKESSLFNLLYDIHLQLGHRCRDGMVRRLKNNYDGISKEIITLFVKCCESCEMKKGKVKDGGVVVQPSILSKDEQNSRCQVVLIDYQSNPDDEFKYIMVYQDHLTKFVILRPLKCKTSEAVAEQLADIFSIFDAPQILQSDNGKEFVDSVIKSLVLKWPQCQKIKGESQHSPSVERAKRDIIDILQIMMADENTFKWASLLPRVQLAKNSRFHSGIKISPFEAIFGRKVSQIGNNQSNDDAGTSVYDVAEDMETEDRSDSETESTEEVIENDASETEDPAISVLREK